jgi:hypothetical protein
LLTEVSRSDEIIYSHLWDIVLHYSNEMIDHRTSTDPLRSWRCSDMPDPAREFFVILDPGQADSALSQLRAVADVTQVLVPRLALVRADRDAMARAARIEGVLDVRDDAPPELPLDFTPAERAFVSAWEARRQPKTRPGEGLSWDAPGFLPPDPPVHHRK